MYESEPNGTDGTNYYRRPLAQYTYDSQNQLLTETLKTYDSTSLTPDSTTTYTYTYDTAGNILSVSEDGSTSKSFTYGNSEWQDLLTAVNGHSIAYDNSGNPTSYYNGSSYTGLTWEQGRNLTRITTGGKTTTYAYDQDGIRTQKTVNGAVAVAFVAVPNQPPVFVVGVPNLVAVVGTAIAANNVSRKRAGGMTLVANLVPAALEFVLRKLENLRGNDGLVTVCHIILRHLALVLLHRFRQKINGKPLLQKRVTLIFFIGKNALHTAAGPLGFAGRCGDAFFRQYFGKTILTFHWKNCWLSYKKA